PALSRNIVYPYARRSMGRVDVLIQHTLEGCSSRPETGGNRDAIGWTLLGLQGDDQPLGYSIYSAAKDGYNERPDHPMSTPNPDELAGPRALSPDGERIQQSIMTLATALSKAFGE